MRIEDGFEEREAGACDAEGGFDHRPVDCWGQEVWSERVRATDDKGQGHKREEIG